jgi:hypothetical protein
MALSAKIENCRKPPSLWHFSEVCEDLCSEPGITPFPFKHLQRPYDGVFENRHLSDQAREVCEGVKSAHVAESSGLKGKWSLAMGRVGRAGQPRFAQLSAPSAQSMAEERVKTIHSHQLEFASSCWHNWLAVSFAEVRLKPLRDLPQALAGYRLDVSFAEVRLKQ